MPRYKLRTLLILLAIGPPVLAGAWWGYQTIEERRRQAEFDQLIELIESTVAPASWNSSEGLGAKGRFEQGLILFPAVEEDADSAAGRP